MGPQAISSHRRGGLPLVFPDNDLDYIANFVNMTFEIGGRHEPNKVLQRALVRSGYAVIAYVLSTFNLHRPVGDNNPRRR